MEAKIDCLNLKSALIMTLSLVLLCFIPAIRLHCLNFCMIIPLLTLLVLCSVVDIETFHIKNAYLPLIMLSGLPVFILSGTAVFSVPCCILVLLCGLLLNLKKSVIGGADIKILALICLICGPLCSATSFIAGCVIAFFYAVLTVVLKRLGCLSKKYIHRSVSEGILDKEKKAEKSFLKKELPFMPFITVGFLLYQAGRW